jgi:hypothetical protein
MHPKWRDLAVRLKDERGRLSEAFVPALHRRTAAMSGKMAPQLGVKILLEDVDSKTVCLGVFDVPPVPFDILQGPEG